jgi:serine/threonine protein kinase
MSSQVCFPVSEKASSVHSHFLFCARFVERFVSLLLIRNQISHATAAESYCIPCKEQHHPPVRAPPPPPFPKKTRVFLMQFLFRDVKLSNLFYDNKGTLKLADFDLATEYVPGKPMTPLVVTLWYRPPELLLGMKNYTPAIDMWSVGCVFAELLLGRSFLPGRSELDQIEKIISMFGTPTRQSWYSTTTLHSPLSTHHLSLFFFLF